MKTLTKTTLSVTGIATLAFFAVPREAAAQSNKFSKFRSQSFQSFSNGSGNSNSRHRNSGNSSSSSSNSGNSNSSSNSSSSKKRLSVSPSYQSSRKPVSQFKPAVQPKTDYQQPNHLNSSNQPRLQVTPQLTTPATPSYTKRPSQPADLIKTRPSGAGNPVADVSKMVSILQGSSKAPTRTPPATSNSGPSNSSPSLSGVTGVVRPGVVNLPPVLDRVVTLNPKALPKGMGTQTYMKKGNTPAVGLPDKPGSGGTATAYMKKGNDRAEGESERGVPVVVRIKDGQPQAESNPHHHGDSGLANHHSSHGGGAHYPGTSSSSFAGGGSYPAAPSIAYKVDSTSQLSTNSVKFRKGSTELADAASYHYLQNLAAALRDPSLSSERFVVEGHASAEGSETSNLILSQQRANAIFDFMISQGIHPDRLLSIGHGEYHARYSPTDPEYLRAQDRQVMVFKLAE